MNSKVIRCFQVYGRVQRVGFRYMVRDKAQALGVLGFAQNLPNGAVDVVVSGSADELESMYNWLHQVPEPARVELVSEREVTTAHSETLLRSSYFQIL